MDTKNKPLSLRRDDFVNNVVDVVNNSGLPLWTVSMLLKDILNVVNQRAVEEHEAEKKYYESKLSESTGDDA